MNKKVYVSNQSVIKITEDVIFMNRYKSNMWGGQYSTYSGITIGLFVFYFSSLLIYYTTSMEEYLNFTSTILFLSIGIIPIFALQQIAWRRELPICFNKKTQKVSAWIDGELAEIEWERFHMFQTKIQDGAQSTAEVWLFTLFGKSGKKYPMTIWDNLLPGGLYALVHDFMNHKEPIITEYGKMEIARGNFQFTYKELFLQRFKFRKEEIFLCVFFSSFQLFFLPYL